MTFSVPALFAGCKKQKKIIPFLCVKDFFFFVEKETFSCFASMIPFVKNELLNDYVSLCVL